MMPAGEIVAHHLRVVGIPTAYAQADTTVIVGTVRLCFVEPPAARLSDTTALGTSLTATSADSMPWGRLRTFRPHASLAELVAARNAVPVVVDGDNLPVWAWVPEEPGGTLYIGTDLAADLTMLRQGDPAAAAQRPSEAMWGVAGERPNYLFEARLDPADPFDRPADWWVWTLRTALIEHAHVQADPVLPFGAPGAVIVTGDDDQAPLVDYQAQAALLGNLPVTYFLHPLTKHDARTLARIARGRSVEWELHPDALDAPASYDAILGEQVEWFARLVGRVPRLVRNHGFLNDGYWGHAQAWLDNGIVGSSNLPGLDGRVVNGSLLPARLALDGRLTDHWSVLTAYGDGVFFVKDWTATTCSDEIARMGRRIVDSGVPGVVVFNLHPANHARAAAMHAAVRRLVNEQGFAAMTLGAAIDWFAARDSGRERRGNENILAPRVAFERPVGLFGRMRGLIARLMRPKAVA